MTSSRIDGVQPLEGAARALAVSPKSIVPQDRKAAQIFARGFFALAALTYFLVVLGALVRANGAGLACPDWPLCFGQVVPDFDVKVAFEWGHRVLAGSVGVFFTILALMTLSRTGLRESMWKPLLIAAVLLAVQVVLGGLTVLELLASWTVTSHLVTGNAFALSLVLLGRRLGRLGTPTQAPSPSANYRQRLATTLAGALLFVQLVVGGLVASTYAGLACPDWPACMNGEYFPSFRGIQGLHLFHRMLGYSVAIAILYAARIARDHAGSRFWMAAAAGLAVTQVGVGIANVLMRIPVEITGLHSALAAGLICCLGVSTREVWRSNRVAAQSN